ncbi:MAG: endonuclease/exonuclease/phosphatase family protein [Candidatus Cloacimonadota bacterium]|nr:endonuclease/exonuclease/phosphatase family protein [Candidatus Cloacimonadota bacterium]
MKNIFLLALLLFTFPLFADELPKIDYPQLKFGDSNSLEIMSWNIQHFPKNVNTVNYAAKIIHAVDPDVVGLQEIESDSAFVVLVNELQIIDPKSKWNGFRADTDEWNLNLAYLYKTAVVEIDSIYQIYPSDSIYHSPFPRKPLVLEFIYRNENYFVINNHLKAMGGEKNESRRKAACKLLDEYIENNLSEEEVFIIGDMNDEIAEPAEFNVFISFINQPEKYRFADMDIAQDSTANWSYPYWKYRGQIDHILITNELFDEFQHKDSEIKTIVIDEYMDGGENARYKYITDHRPVAIKLQIQ